MGFCKVEKLEALLAVASGVALVLSKNKISGILEKWYTDTARDNNYSRILFKEAMDKIDREQYSFGLYDAQPNNSCFKIK